jgi:uncharacterized protein (TIGR02646 family)
MLIINKKEPSFYTEFVKKNRPSNWEDFDIIRHDLRMHLLKEEQNFLCTYCETRISDSNEKSHIDHIRPRDKFPSLFDNYDNLTASCNKPNRCGKKKGKYWIEDFIHPVENEPSKYFYYLPDGTIQSNDLSGSNTIEFLNLNDCKDERMMIRKIMDSYKKQYSKEEVLTFLSEESFITFIQYYLNYYFDIESE